MACFGKWGCCGGRKVRASSRKGNDWRIFSLKELQAATNNFNYDNKLGEGGFGSVYWGQLWDGSQIAVKRFKVWSSKAEMEFSVEAEILGRVRHKNLLNLRGYCAEGQECLVVYDYMANLSLYSHLHGQFASEGLLDWDKRMNIAVGAAEGVMYLHHFATPHIVHRDVKASNILLDSHFTAQVADFGFAKLIVEGASHATKVKGNLGYLAPEYETFSKASESCDVYSFGVLLLELVSGRKAVEKTEDGIECNIVDWATPMLEDGKVEELVDTKLQGRYVEEELMRVIHVATMCVRHSPEERPTMLQVVSFLKGTTKDHDMVIVEDSTQNGYDEENGVDSSKKHSSEHDSNK